MIFGKVQLRDPITTLGGSTVAVSQPTASAAAVTTVDKIQVVHAIPVQQVISTNQQLYALPIANQAVLCLRANPQRRGLTIINNNPLANIYVSFGADYPINRCVPISPGGSDVMDTASTPQDAVYVTSDTANSSVLILEFQAQ